MQETTASTNMRTTELEMHIKEVERRAHAEGKNEALMEAIPQFLNVLGIVGNPAHCHGQPQIHTQRSERFMGATMSVRGDNDSGCSCDGSEGLQVHQSPNGACEEEQRCCHSGPTMAIWPENIPEMV